MAHLLPVYVYVYVYLPFIATGWEAGEHSSQHMLPLALLRVELEIDSKTVHHEVPDSMIHASIEDKVYKDSIRLVMNWSLPEHKDLQK